MKSLKIFLIVTLLLLVLAAGTAGYVWWKLQRVMQIETLDTPATSQSLVPVTTPVAKTVPAEGIKINTDAVSVEQKAAASKVGIDLDTVTITPQMVACAENKLGSDRVAEIMNGASPSVLESMTLLGCI